MERYLCGHGLATRDRVAGVYMEDTSPLTTTSRILLSLYASLDTQLIPSTFEQNCFDVGLEITTTVSVAAWHSRAKSSSQDRENT